MISDNAGRRYRVRIDTGVRSVTRDAHEMVLRRSGTTVNIILYKGKWQAAFPAIFTAGIRPNRPAKASSRVPSLRMVKDSEIPVTQYRAVPES